MVGNLKNGDQIRPAHMRFRKNKDYEAYINILDAGYDSEDALCSGFFYKLITPHFNKVNRSQNRNGCDFKHEISEDHGDNFFIPTKSCCFVKCNIFLTGQYYKQQYLDFIRS